MTPLIDMHRQRFISRWFDGLTRRGVAILLAVAVVNALRRNINSRLLREDFGEWLIDVAHATALGFSSACWSCWPWSPP
jgi:hypothetical protein